MWQTGYMKSPIGNVNVNAIHSIICCLMDIIKLIILLISISVSLSWAKSSEASKSEEDGNVEVLPGEFKHF